MWDTFDGQCLGIFSDHVASIYTASFCPDGRYFATAGGDGHVNVYDVKVCFLSLLPFVILHTRYSGRSVYGCGIILPINRLSSRSTGSARTVSVE